MVKQFVFQLVNMMQTKKLLVMFSYQIYCVFFALYKEYVKSILISKYYPSPKNEWT